MTELDTVIGVLRYETAEGADILTALAVAAEVIQNDRATI